MDRYTGFLLIVCISQPMDASMIPQYLWSAIWEDIIMLYRQDRSGNKISQLGYGCMRFTRKGSAIDYDKAQREVMYAIEQGVNYFDTAYVYPGSEECLGRILQENHCREKVAIATKLPQYMMRSPGAIEKTFT